MHARHTQVDTMRIREQNNIEKEHSPYDAKLVKVPSSSLGPKGLLEGYNNTGNVVPVPEGAEHHVAKPKQWEQDSNT